MVVEELLKLYPEEVQSLARDARKAVIEWLPAVDEAVDPAARMLAYRMGPGYKGMVCTLILSKSGVKLGIVNGAALPDPHNLLRSAGKVHRHVPLNSAEDLRQPGLKRLVVAAAAACRKRLQA